MCECGGCPSGLTGEVWAHNPEDTGSDPREGGKFLFEKVPPAHPSVKQVPGLVLGSKVHWPSLTNYCMQVWPASVATLAYHCTISLMV